jgi:hypothetical protein
LLHLISATETMTNEAIEGYDQDETRDGLKTERVRRVARYSIPGSARKNWRNVLGSTAYPESKNNGDKSLLLTR